MLRFRFQIIFQEFHYKKNKFDIYDAKKYPVYLQAILKLKAFIRIAMKKKFYNFPKQWNELYNSRVDF